MNWKNGVKLHEQFPKLSESQIRRIKNGAKIKVCDEKREGWIGELPFYIFWCVKCEIFSYDYPHGFIQHQHLICHRCSGRTDFVPWWVDWAQPWGMIRISLAMKFGEKK